MEKLKRLVILWLLALLIAGAVSSPEISLAAGKKQFPNAPTQGIPAKNPHHGEGNTTTDVNSEATQYFMSGESFINYMSGNIVTVSGNTKAYTSVDTITVDLYLQRWDATKSQWVDALHVGEFQDFNSSVVSGSRDLTVARGYYYRTRTHHWISEGGIVEQGDSTSSYIYVN